MSDFLRATALMLALLNPFLVIVYLLDIVQKLERPAFRRVMVRAAVIAGSVFSCFALAGDPIFSGLVQADFASFQIFGGVVFLLIGLQFVFRGPTAIEMLRGESEHLAGAIAMPVLIGPGTLSASVIIGKRLSPLAACASILIALAVSIAVMIALKKLHDQVRKSNAALVQRYIAIAGRITALYVGTVAVEMIMQGLQTWMQKA